MCQGCILRVILKFGIFLMKMQVVLIIKRRALPGDNLSYHDKITDTYQTCN